MQKSFEIPATNNYIKTILQASTNQRRISVELTPNSNFKTDVLGKIGPTFVAVTWLGNVHLEVPLSEIPAMVLARKLCASGYSVLLHLTGRNVGKKEMMDILTYVKSIGVKNILALQGDQTFHLEEDDSKCDFPYAADLVLFIKKQFGDDFCVGVAAYPSCDKLEENMIYLKQKVSSGADFIITQASFEYEAFEKFAIACKEHDVNIPILPGIFLIKSNKALTNITKYCGFKAPINVMDFFKANEKNGQISEDYGLDLASGLIRKCLDNQRLFAGVHIFSMNNLDDIEKALLRL